MAKTCPAGLLCFNEGTLLFFPSPLYHSVHPYFDCDEERISVSGNIRLNTAKRI